MFGFNTVRVDADASHARKTFSQTGFGEVVARGDRVWMWDAGAGTFGYLDAASGRVTRFGRVTTRFRDETSVPVVGTIALDARREWLVTGPGRVRAFARSGLPAGEETVLEDGDGATFVVAAGGRVFAVYGAGDRTDFTLLGTEGFGVAIGFPASDIVALSSAGNDLWVFTRERAIRVDTVTHGTAAIKLTDAVPGGIATATVADGMIWAVARDRADLVRIDPSTGKATARLRYLGADRPFRQPTQLATGLGDVWLLAPTRAEPERHDARVIRVHAPSRTATPTVSYTVDTPSSLFVGGIAVTTR
jgi:hypothetical protein